MCVYRLGIPMFACCCAGDRSRRVGQRVVQHVCTHDITTESRPQRPAGEKPNVSSDSTCRRGRPVYPHIPPLLQTHIHTHTHTHIHQRSARPLAYGRPSCHSQWRNIPPARHRFPPPPFPPSTPPYPRTHSSTIIPCTHSHIVRFSCHPRWRTTPPSSRT